MEPVSSFYQVELPSVPRLLSLLTLINISLWLSFFKICLMVYKCLPSRHSVPHVDDHFSIDSLYTLRFAPFRQVRVT